MIAGRGSMFIEYLCRTRGGRACRAILATDAQGGAIPAEALAEMGRKLAPCLGRRWIDRVPQEHPFG